jgi:hypothetical protein
LVTCSKTMLAMLRILRADRRPASPFGYRL